MTSRLSRCVLDRIAKKFLDVDKKLDWGECAKLVNDGKVEAARFDYKHLGLNEEGDKEYKKWSESENKTLRNLIKNGYTYAMAAVYLGRSYGSIDSQASKIGSTYEKNGYKRPSKQRDTKVEPIEIDKKSNDNQEKIKECLDEKVTKDQGDKIIKLLADIRNILNDDNGKNPHREILNEIIEYTPNPYKSYIKQSVNLDISEDVIIFEFDDKHIDIKNKLESNSKKIRKGLEDLFGEGINVEFKLKPPF